MGKPVFEKRHYLKLAAYMFDRIPRPPSVAGLHNWWSEVEGLANMLKVDNPNFQPDRFILACEYGVNAKGVGAGISGGPAMPYFQGNTPLQTAQARAASRARRQR